ncbi:MAG: MFS transporter [Promethearchaeota archaeon]
MSEKLNTPNSKDIDNFNKSLDNVQVQNKSKFWVNLFPYLFIISSLIGGYVVGFKLIQLGFPDLGIRILKLPEQTVDIGMALMAIFACISAIISGIYIDKKQFSLRIKLYMMIVGGGLQGAILGFMILFPTPNLFVPWIIAFSLVLGFLFPLIYSFVYYFIPTKTRGLVAGLITGIAYFFGNISPFEWNFEDFIKESIVIMIPAVILLGLLLLNHRKIELYEIKDKKTVTTIESTKDIDKNSSKEIAGRFLDRNLFIVTLFMFGVYFIDSFGFMQVISEDTILNVTWRGPIETRLLFGLIHFIAAIIMGFLYYKFNEKIVFICSFIGFTVGDFLFSLYPSGTLLIITSLIYCATVSFYTINSFVVWADISTEKNISKNAGIGIGIGGWLSSFISTSLTNALSRSLTGIEGFSIHMRISGSIAVVFLILMIFYMWKFSKSKKK